MPCSQLQESASQPGRSQQRECKKTMNDVQRAEKLALARKKLKDFEAKRKTGPSPAPTADGRCSSLSNGSTHSIDRIEASFVDREPFMVVNSNGSDNLHIDRQTNGSSVSSMNSSVVITNGTQEDPSISHTFSSAIETRLIQERDTAVQACEQMKTQLSELHSHYAHLHAAYSQLSSSGVHSDMESQIIQLQSAVSVLVEEKTNLQSELRAARQQCEQIALSHIKVQADTSSFQLEQELRNLRTRLDQANSLLQAQAAELEQQRQLSAETQAKKLSIQNEKSEAQLRVKALLKERDTLNEELTTVKKDLQMKNLHLKQLSTHQVHNPVEAAATNDRIQSLTDRLETLTNELIAVRSERDAVVRESETTRRQFDQYSAELAEKNGNLRQQLESAEDQRSLLETRLQELEMQLNQLQNLNVPASSEALTAPTVVSQESAEQAKKIKLLEERISELSERYAQERQQTKEHIENQAAAFAQKEEELLNLSIKLRHFEERVNESRANEPELLELSKQLQAEKATVSRAVAQNKELKEQLIETEDRLVAITNEKMQCELDKQAAEHQVRQLTEQLQNVSAGNKMDESGGVDHLDTSAVEALAMRNEREHELEQKLQQALQELSDVRQELRQSHSRNEQMNQIMMTNAEDENQNSIHVELGQALERMNQMAQENEQMREMLASARERETTLLKSMASTNETPQADETEEATEEEDNSSWEAVKPEFSTIPDNDMEKWARQELEKKFNESMKKIAELSDNIDKLEHINMQLQMENETIGDHVILYHQQRKIIRDRIRTKDQQLLSMEAEKQRVLERCRELQQTLKEVLAAKDGSNMGSVNKRACRTYSHSTVDEMSGDEDVVVSSEETVEAAISQDDNVINNEEGRPLPHVKETEAKVQRIFNILEEINTTPVATEEDLHCSHCVGELKKL